MDMHNVRYAEIAYWGGDLREEVYPVSAWQIAQFSTNSYDLGNECYPMSECGWNAMRTIPGFLEMNGTSYRHYVIKWFQVNHVHYEGKRPPDNIAENAYKMFKFRKDELLAVQSNANALVFEIGRAQRNLDLARHVYGWSQAHEWSQRKGLPLLEVFEQLDFFDCYRIVSGLDLYILPLQLMRCISVAFEMKHGKMASRQCFVLSLATDWPIEIVLKEPGTPHIVVFSKQVRENQILVATLGAALITQVTTLDQREIAARMGAAMETKVLQSEDSFEGLDLTTAPPANPGLETRETSSEV